MVLRPPVRLLPGRRQGFFALGYGPLRGWGSSSHAPARPVYQKGMDSACLTRLASSALVAELLITA